MATKAELEETLARRDETIRVFRGMLRKRNKDIAALQKRFEHYRDHYRAETKKRGNYQIRMYAALRALREIAGSTYGKWPNGWAATVANERLKEDALQEAIDNGKVKGKRVLPRQ